MKENFLQNLPKKKLREMSTAKGLTKVEKVSTQKLIKFLVKFSYSELKTLSNS
jgi:hypothetical protein